MKTLITTLVLAVTTSVVGQTKVEPQTTEFKGYITAGGCGNHCILTFQKNLDSSEDEELLLQQDSTGKIIINPEAKDLLMIQNKVVSVNKRYSYKPLKIKCKRHTITDTDSESKKYSYQKWVVTSIEFDYPIDNFNTATAKLYMDGQLVGIIENKQMYSFSKNGDKSDKGEKGYQNGNEICYDNLCLRLVVNKDGFIERYRLPNTTDGLVIGKIIGNKIYSCAKPDGSDIKPNVYYTFKGDKQQAVTIARKLGLLP